MRVALIHDWLTGFRGGEKVLEAICTLYPDADLFTLFHRPGSTCPTIERMRIHTSWLQRLPGIYRYYRACLPLFPFTVEQFDLDGYDLVVSTSHCVVKSVLRPGRARHLCYCHTPMRYAWDQFDAYFGPARIGRVRSLCARPMLAALARWDARTADRVDRYVANSQYVARRIGRYYNREATVVYPPVDTEFFSPAPAAPGTFSALMVTALVPYKRIDLAAEACRLAGVPLRVVGTGPDRERLEHQAGPHVTFLGYQSDEALRTLYREAGVILHTAEEDFGISLVEAQACGRPVVALARGGACETVLDQQTGLLVSRGEPDAFADALRRAEATRFDPEPIRQHALGFGRKRFLTEIAAQISTLLDDNADAHTA